jgi:hypothetical protein
VTSNDAILDAKSQKCLFPRKDQLDGRPNAKGFGDLKEISFVNHATHTFLECIACAN